MRVKFRSLYHGGFTLVEIIVSIAVFGILTALMISIFSPEVVRGTDPLYSMRAAALGQSYLEEILGKRFDENSPFGNARRCGEIGGPGACSGIGTEEVGHINFDDVDDYNGLNESPPIDSSGNARQGYANYRVQVAVVDAPLAEVGVANTKRIDITITDPRTTQYVFSAYKANF